MPGFYYIDLLFDPDATGPVVVQELCINGLVAAGCEFNSLIIPHSEDFNYDHGGVFDEMDELDMDLLANFTRDYIADMEKEGRLLISFPPSWGRIKFRYPFELDFAVLDEVEEEQSETGSTPDELGLSFMYTVHQDMGRKIKATLSLWEDYVLLDGSPATRASNMKKVLHLVEFVCRSAEPYFGAMNSELHIDTDRSLDLMLAGRLPEGNDFIYVGRKIRDGLNSNALKQAELPVHEVPGGGMLIQFRDRWGVGNIFTFGTEGN